MDFKNHFVALAVISLGINSSFAATTPVGKAINDSQSVLNYWTPERLKNAKPIPLPKVDPKQIKFENSKTNIEPSVGAPAAEPTIQIQPNEKKLFESGNNLNVTIPQDVGTSGLHFTSSQLIPLSADRSYPYSAVGKLFFSDGGSNYVCSASVIAKRLVVTAGHCVHRGSGGTAGFFNNFLFIPAFRDNTAPFERWTASYVNTTSAWMTGSGYVPNAGDFAILEMNDNTIQTVVRTISEVTGSLGYLTNKTTPNHLHLLGYPCNLDSCQKMHQVTATNGPAVSPNNASYGSDMTGGSSGGPWIQNFGKFSSGQTGGLNTLVNRVVGVTSWGYRDTAPKVQGASIFDSTFTTLYNQLCAHKVGNC